MTIYKVTYRDAQEGTILEWHTSRAAARHAWVMAKRRAKESASTVELHDIAAMTIKPTKQGLLVFLNKHTPSRDNG